MTNSYYTFTPAFIAGQTVRSGAVNTQFNALVSAFDLLPSSTSALRTNKATFAGSSTGSGNAYAVAMPNTRIANASGDEVVFVADRTNTGAATLNVDGIGAVSLRKSNGQVLVANDILIGLIYTARYDSTNTRFQLVSPSATHISDAVTRELLTANRTYYVRTDGSDSNTGLVDSAGGAFLTIQKAVSVVCNIDQGPYNAKIKVADGTYNGDIVCARWGGAVGSNLDIGDYSGSGATGKPGQIDLEGNLTTPANCIIDSAAGTGQFACLYVLGMSVRIKGFNLKPAVNQYCITADQGSTVYVGKCNFQGNGAGTLQMFADVGGVIQIIDDYSVSGSAYYHMAALHGGHFVSFQASITITLTGTPAFLGAFAWATDGGVLFTPNLTFSGSATGPRYYAATNGVIQTEGGGASYFPGNSAGSTATGGQYE